MKTKTFFMAFAAIAAVSMSSCSQEEELVAPANQLSDNAITFGTYIGASRGTVITTAALKDNDATGFGVIAYNTGTNTFGAEGQSQTTNFMYNQQVTWAASETEGAEGAWTYSPLKYWPNNGDKLSFFAYAPYTNLSSDKSDGSDTSDKTGITAFSTNNTAGAPTLTFKMATTVSNQIDLLYADANASEGKTTDLTKQSNAVYFKFKHALSRISFYRQALIDNDAKKALDQKTTITISKVTFKAANLATGGTLDLSTGKWRGHSYGNNEYVLESSDFETNANKLTSNDATTASKLTGEKGHIMFIPEVNTNTTEVTPAATYSMASRADGGASTSTITIEYTVETEDDNLDGKKAKLKTSQPSMFPQLPSQPAKLTTFCSKSA